MPNPLQQFRQDLLLALQQFDWESSNAIIDKTIQAIRANPDDSDNYSVIGMLWDLRRQRQFPALVRLADTQIQFGEANIKIYRLLAQGLIDGGQLTAARYLLRGILNDSSIPLNERAESIGLLGRLAKQIYVNSAAQGAGRDIDLSEAIRHYREAYELAPQRYPWHGINWVACAELARARQLRLAALPDTRQVAQSIHDQLSADPNKNFAELTTLAECCLALGDWKQARQWIEAAAAHPHADAFGLSSALRQYLDVWRLQESDLEQGAIIGVLRQALLRSSGGSIDAAALEKVFGNASYEPFAWLKTAVNTCTSVIKIRSRVGRGIGTGFVVEGGDFLPAWQGKKLILTNHHVVSPGAVFPGSVAPEGSAAFSEVLNKSYPLKKLLNTSPPQLLDYSILEAEGLEDKDLPAIPLLFKVPAGMKRVYIIGHPEAKDLSISLQDSNFTGANSTYLHYKTPTVGGNSGSPVFEPQDWQAIGLHHAGKPLGWPDVKDQLVNEGILLSAIREDIKKLNP
jgi:tetratricopeptide (TPR) repeat protein